MWHKSLLDTVRQAKKRGLVLYGAGFWGEIAHKVFTKMGCSPVCFCDDDPNKQGATYCGISILPLEQAIQQYPEAIFLPCTDGRKTATRNPIMYQHMIQRLIDLHVYDSHSELRISLYAFLLDLDQPDNGTNSPMPDDMIMADDVQNIIIFNHMGYCGSLYLEELLDGHPNILLLPYATHVLIKVYQMRLQYLEGEELLIEIAAQMTGYLKSSFANFSSNDDARVYGMACDERGNFIPDVLIDPNDFMHYLRLQFAGNSICLNSLGHMMKVYASAYAACIGRKRQDSLSQSGYWFFYHMHKVDWDVKNTFQYFNKDEFQRIENLYIIREPIQQLCSWQRTSVVRNHNNNWEKNNPLFPQVIKSELGVFLQKQPGIENVRAIRFEDLKRHTVETMQSLCSWLNIPYDDCLTTTTVNGYQVYTKTVSATGTLIQITGNDTTAIDRNNFREFLTSWDEIRLNIAYSKFKQAYGYESDVPSFTVFGKDTLKEIFKSASFQFADMCQADALEYGDIDDSFNVNEYLVNLLLNYFENYQDSTEYYDYIRPKI